MKKYTINPPNRKVLTKYWKEMEAIQDRFYAEIMELEKKMEKETGIKEIEFFSCDGEYVGIGTGDRKMKLVQDLRG